MNFKVHTLLAAIVLPLIAAGSIPLSAQTMTNPLTNVDGTTTPKVFAHYMVCCATVGGAPTLEDYKNEIGEAQKRGIDGFALNCGNWAKQEPYYKQRSVMMYEAARQLGTDFKLFISADGAAKGEIQDIVSTVRDLPNQFYYQGKLVLSTFGGQGDQTKKSGYALTAMIDQTYGTGDKRTIAFVPFFYPQPNITELPEQHHVDQVFNDFPSLDGFFFFGAAGNGQQLTRSDTLLAKKWLGAGKIYMSGIAPYYRANGGNYRLFETRGFEAMSQEWENAIRNKSTWVELVTWNDWNESSYLSPFGPPEETNFWKGHFGPMMLSHVAYLDASRYYIDWYKTGIRPTITQDKLYYFYRLHPKSLDATVNAQPPSAMGRPDHADSLHDSVFTTVFLKAPAQLTVYTGNKQQSFDLQAGPQNLEVPFDFGKQRFVLKRGGKVVIDKTGEFEISATDASSRFNYFSGGVEAEK